MLSYCPYRIPIVLLMLLIFTCPSPLTAEEEPHPFRIKIRTKISLLRSQEVSPTLLLHLRSPLFGSVAVALHARSLFDGSGGLSDPPAKSPKNYQGQFHRNGKDYKVAASKIGGTLQIILPVFRGRRERFASITVPLSDSDSKGRISIFHRISPLPFKSALLDSSEGDFSNSSSSSLAESSPSNSILRLSLFVDSSFASRTTYEEVAASIVNAAELFFLQDLGIALQIVEVRYVGKRGRASLSASNSYDLLDQFSTFVRKDRSLLPADGFHLFTGRRIDGNIVGLSALGRACRKAQAVGLTSRVGGSLQPIVFAHEIGHLLGATHPEESLSAPPPSIMSGFVRPGNTEFSEFSTAEIFEYIEGRGACVDSEEGVLSRLSLRGGKSVQARLLAFQEGCFGVFYRPSASPRSEEAQFPLEDEFLFAFELPENALFEREIRNIAPRPRSSRIRKVRLKLGVVCMGEEFQEVAGSRLTLDKKRAGRNVFRSNVLRSSLAQDITSVGALQNLLEG